MSRTLTLTASAIGSTNGSGNGSIQLGPGAPGTIWYPTSVSIYMTGSYPTVSGSNTPLCTIYTGGASNPSNQVDVTFQVLGASSSVISGQVIYPGQYIYAVWQYGNANAKITFNIYGTKQVP